MCSGSHVRSLSSLSDCRLTRQLFLGARHRSRTKAKFDVTAADDAIFQGLVRSAKRAECVHENQISIGGRRVRCGSRLFAFFETASHGMGGYLGK